MNKCWLLLKIQLLGFFNINRVLHTRDKSEQYRLVGMGALILLVFFIMVGYSAGIAIAAAHFGMVEILPALILVTAALCTLIVTFLKCNGMLFGLRDYDMVMSLPVRTTTVVLSRLIAVYAMNVLLSGIIMLPSIIVFGAACGVSASVWCMLALSLFLAPLLPMMISMLAGVVITAVSMRFRYKNLLTILLSTIALLAIFLASFAMPREDAALAGLADAAAETVTRAYPAAELYINALTNNDWGSFLQFAGLSVGLSMLFVILLSIFFHKINSALFSVRAKSNFRLKTLKTASPFMALYKKELRRLVSSPVYVMNTGIGAIMLLLMSIALLLVDPDTMTGALGLTGDMLPMGSFAPWIVAFFVSISASTAASISLEGKSRWLMCSAPVATKTIFDAKIAVSLSYLVPAILISCTLLAVRLQTGFLETLALFVIPLLFSAFISVAGLAFNLKFPKYDWTSEYQAVKQSASVLATIMTGMGSVLALCLLTMRLGEMPVLSLLLSSILLASISAVVYRKLSVHALFE